MKKLWLIGAGKRMHFQYMLTFKNKNDGLPQEDDSVFVVLAKDVQSAVKLINDTAQI